MKNVKDEATRVYGASDDLIEFEGGISGEVGYYGKSGDEDEHGCLLVFSDGTILAAVYGKPQGGIWALTLVAKGSLLIGIEACTDEDAKPHSDVATFGRGLKWAYAAPEWEKVR